MMKKRKILSAIFLLTAMACLAYSGYMIWNRNRAERNLKEIKKIVITDIDKETVNIDDIHLARKVKYEELAKLNTDTYGWVFIPDTPIDFYVMNEPERMKYFYADKDIKREWSRTGSIFIPKADETLDDPRLIMLGHAMLGKGKETMFSKVTNYNYTEFFQEHPYIYTYANGNATRWKVWASVLTTEDDLMYQYDVKRSSEEHRELYQYITDNAKQITGETPKLEEDILVLSTCDWSIHQHTGRAYVVAVKDMVYNQYTNTVLFQK